jgi:hypothetical protein
MDTIEGEQPNSLYNNEGEIGPYYCTLTKRKSRKLQKSSAFLLFSPLKNAHEKKKTNLVSIVDQNVVVQARVCFKSRGSNHVLLQTLVPHMFS